MNNETNNVNHGSDNNFNNNQINGFNQNQNNNSNTYQQSNQDINMSNYQSLSNSNTSLADNKIFKNLKNDFLTLAIISLVVSVAILYLNEDSVIIRAIMQIGYTLLLFLGYFLARGKKQSAGILGIVIGILMILTFFSSIIDGILGIFLLTHAIKYNKLF